MHKDQPKLDN